MMKSGSPILIKKDKNDRYIHVFKKGMAKNDQPPQIHHILLNVQDRSRYGGHIYNHETFELTNRFLSDSLAELSSKVGHQLQVEIDNSTIFYSKNISELIVQAGFQSSFRVSVKNIKINQDFGKGRYSFYILPESKLKQTVIHPNSIVLVELNDDGIERIHVEVFKNSTPVISYPIVGEKGDNGMYLFYPHLETLIYSLGYGVFKKKSMIVILNYKTGKRSLIKNI